MAAGACVGLARHALAVASEAGQALCLIVGDLRQDPLPAAAAAELALGGWRALACDLGVATHAAIQVELRVATPEPHLCRARPVPVATAARPQLAATHGCGCSSQDAARRVLLLLCIILEALVAGEVPLQLLSTLQIDF